MATKENSTTVPEALEPQLAQLVTSKGLVQGELSGAECFYVGDDGESLVAEYKPTQQHSWVPGRPSSMAIGQSSMRDGERALVVTW